MMPAVLPQVSPSAAKGRPAPPAPVSVPDPWRRDLLGFIDPILFRRSYAGGYRILQHRAVHRASYERWLARTKASGAASWALRGRVLRLLGEERQARDCFVRAVREDPGCAAAHAWRWEMERSLDPPVGGAGLARAIRLEPGNPQWLLMQGADSLIRLRYEEGLTLLKRSLALDPARPLAHALTGYCYHGLRRWASASASFTEVLTREPAAAWAHRIRAACRLRLQDRDGCVQDLEAMMRQEESVGEWAVLVQKSLEKRGIGALLAWLDKAVEGSRRPEAWVLFLRGYLERSEGVNRFEQAAADLEAALRLRPRCAWGWAYLGRARGNMGDPRARADLDRAVRLDPACGWILAWRGELRRRLGDTRGALADLNRAVSLEPYYDMAYAWRGGVRLALGRPQGALADLDVAVEMNPGYGWSWHERMRALRRLGRVHEALADLERARRLDSKFVYAQRPEDLPRALRELDGAVAERARCAAAAAWRGEVRMRLGDAAGALADLDRALSLDRTCADAYVWRGRVYAHAGRPAAALRDFARALKRRPKHPEAHLWSAQVRVQRGDLRGAWTDLGAALRLNPCSVKVRMLRGQVAAGLGRWERARAEFDAALELSARDLEALLGRAGVQWRLGRRQEAFADLDAASRLRPEDVRVRALRRSMTAVSA